MKDYKKILEGVIDIISTTEKSDIGFANICTYIGENCPELKESEDEKIRKALIHFISEQDGFLTAINGINVKDILSWLEKQDDKLQYWKPSEEQLKALDYAYNSCPDTERGNYYEGVLGTIIDDLHKLSEKQGEQKPYGRREECFDCQMNYAGECKGSCAMKRGKQKPADKKGMNLVEEDMTPFQKKVFCIIDTAIEEEQGLKQVCDELLRLAHDEIMQKPTWSEENEAMWAEISNLLWEGYKHSGSKFSWDDIRNWVNPKLKSLKERYTWKSSDEQMEALRKAEATIGVNHVVLAGLISDLEKLKDEKL